MQYLLILLLVINLSFAKNYNYITCNSFGKDKLGSIISISPRESFAWNEYNVLSARVGDFKYNHRVSEIAVITMDVTLSFIEKRNYLMEGIKFVCYPASTHKLVKLLSLVAKVKISGSDYDLKIYIVKYSTTSSNNVYSIASDNDLKALDSDLQDSKSQELSNAKHIEHYYIKANNVVKFQDITAEESENSFDSLSEDDEYDNIEKRIEDSKALLEVEKLFLKKFQLNIIENQGGNFEKIYENTRESKFNPEYDVKQDSAQGFKSSIPTAYVEQQQASDEAVSKRSQTEEQQEASDEAVSERSQIEQQQEASDEVVKEKNKKTSRKALFEQVLQISCDDTATLNPEKDENEAHVYELQKKVYEKYHAENNTQENELKTIEKKYQEELAKQKSISNENGNSSTELNKEREIVKKYELTYAEMVKKLRAQENEYLKRTKEINKKIERLKINMRKCTKKTTDETAMSIIASTAQKELDFYLTLLEELNQLNNTTKSIISRISVMIEGLEKEKNDYKKLINAAKINDAKLKMERENTKKKDAKIEVLKRQLKSLEEGK